MKRPAFSVVELLVVIGVIALLIGILIPTLAQARTQARSVQCQSNLRQWATAVIAYASESNNYLPRRGQGVQKVTVIDRPPDWFNALPPLFKQKPYAERFAVGKPSRGDDGSVWSCPEFRIVETHAHQFGYAMNMNLSTWNVLMADKINRVGPTSTLVFMADAPGPYASIFPTPPPAAYNPVARHKGRVNLAFLDGHVAGFLASEAGINVGEPQRNDLYWTPKNSQWAGP